MLIKQQQQKNHLQNILTKQIKITKIKLYYNILFKLRQMNTKFKKER